MLERLVPRPLLSGRADGYLKPRPEPALLSSLEYARGALLWKGPEPWRPHNPPSPSPRVCSAFAACCPRELYGVPGNEMPDSLFSV